MPADYYDMAISDFRDLLVGANQRLKRQQAEQLELHRSLRRAAYIGVLPNAKDGFSFESFCADFWPLPGDKEKVMYDPKIDAETYESILKAHNLKIQKGRRDGGN